MKHYEETNLKIAIVRNLVVQNQLPLEWSYNHIYCVDGYFSVAKSRGLKSFK